MSLNFGHCPISELTTYSPRMVNNSIPCTHTRLNTISRAYEMRICHFMPYHVTCIMRATCNSTKTWIIIFSTYNSHPSKEHISTRSFHTQHVIQSSNNTRNGPNLGPIKTRHLSVPSPLRTIFGSICHRITMIPKHTTKPGHQSWNQN